MNRRITSRGIPLALLAVLALSGSGCGGGSSTVAPAVYVKSVCTSLASWSTAVKDAGSQLALAASGTTSLTQGKGQYVRFVTALVNVTGRAASDLKSAGAPTVSNGSQISDALVQAFTRARAALSGAAAKAANIPITSAASYQAAAAGVTGTIRQTLAHMASANPKKSPALRGAAAKEPACRAIRAR